MTASIVGEVGAFLADLKLEFPDLFRVPRPVARPAPPPLAPAPAPPPAEGGEHALRAKAVEAFGARAAHWGSVMGISYKKVRVKDQRTLWGSCSREGNLNFNWRVVMAPPEVLDYLVIHELSHRVEMNHSPRFWALVARHAPEHKAHRRWLRENGRALYARKRA